MTAVEPDGFNPSAWKGDKFSPNLNAWLRGTQQRNLGLHDMFVDADGARWLGQIDEDGWFIGSCLASILTRGGRALVGTWFPASDGLTRDADFWKRYSNIGRCAIDERHRMHFIGGDTRWVGNEDRRSCVWCGAFEQVRERWVEKVDRERWVAAPDLAGIKRGRALSQGEG